MVLIKEHKDDKKVNNRRQTPPPPPPFGNYMMQAVLRIQLHTLLPLLPKYKIWPVLRKKYIAIRSTEMQSCISPSLAWTALVQAIPKRYLIVCISIQSLFGEVSAMFGPDAGIIKSCTVFYRVHSTPTDFLVPSQPISFRTESSGFLQINLISTKFENNVVL